MSSDKTFSMPNTSNAVDNPLIWPVYGLLQQNPKSWKLNELYAELQRRGLMSQLAEDPQRQLFKMNFLLMNALYQLRELLDTTQQLMISVLDIRLLTLDAANRAEPQTIADCDRLGEYYLNWKNFEVSGSEVDALLSSFWRTFRQQHGVGPDSGGMGRQQALALFGLDESAGPSRIRQQWRRLAFRWHPDRAGGDEEKFKALCNAWQSLRQ